MFLFLRSVPLFSRVSFQPPQQSTSWKNISLFIFILFNFLIIIIFYIRKFKVIFKIVNEYATVEYLGMRDILELESEHAD